MESSGAFQLIMLRGPQPEKIFRLSQEEIHLGRESRNELAINDPEVSRQHSRLVRQGGGYVIEDMGSTNGTFVNGNRINSPYALSDGDEIGLGETITLLYESVVSASTETIMSPGAALEAPFKQFDSFEAEPVPPEPASSLPFSPEPIPFPPLDSEPGPVPPPPFASKLEPVPPPPFAFEPEPAPPPSLGSEAEPVPLPPFAWESEPMPPPPLAEKPDLSSPSPPPPMISRPATTATPVTPPRYDAPEEAVKPKSRKGLLIGCGCLLLLIICAVVSGLGYLFWNAPYEFWQDPINNLDLLFTAILPLSLMI